MQITCWGHNAPLGWDGGMCAVTTTNTSTTVPVNFRVNERAAKQQIAPPQDLTATSSCGNDDDELYNYYSTSDTEFCCCHEMDMKTLERMTNMSPEDSENDATEMVKRKLRVRPEKKKNEEAISSAELLRDKIANRHMHSLPLEAKEILRAWLRENADYPWPSMETKKSLARETNLAVFQVCNFLINERKRSKETASHRWKCSGKVRRKQHQERSKQQPQIESDSPTSSSSTTDTTRNNSPS